LLRLSVLDSRFRGNERSKREPSSRGAVGESLSRSAIEILAAVNVALPSENLPHNMQRHTEQFRLWLFVLGAAAAYYPRFVKLPAGMETFSQAASCLWHGEMLQVCDQGFTYPPFFAFLMLPFVPMRIQAFRNYRLSIARCAAAAPRIVLAAIFCAAVVRRSSFSRCSKTRPMTRWFSWP
jgi:hypothetical protein